jgi:pyridoxamine 5'-phosphate oxidase
MSDPPAGKRSPVVPSDLRVEYSRGVLDERDLASDPIEQFTRWFADAQAANVAEANAMTLATVGADGTPSARIVLLKGCDTHGFTFYTNYNSRKGRELAGNSRAALCFFWQPLERQVRVEGIVERASVEESEAYFRTRPVAAQIGAWVSEQSTPIASREQLEKLNRELTERFGNGPVPRPEHWGGFRVVPHAIEFWQGRASRLHDRFLYTRQPDGSWKRERLSP